MKLLAPEALQHLPAVILPRLIQMFGSTTPPLLVEIRQHASAGNLPAMAQAAHKLKGSCVSLGAEQMAEICKTLQHKGECGDAAGISALLEELEGIYPATLAALQTI
ncbi:Hpt domain-containing protein [Thiothrix fructosivorans]|uniref:Hpt domain-containing protein n=1 Tax=Thiothrix fructosivorans TaxID=111770 RepID=A0A8B0SSI3_9GAMM|nr:Hpt domain-containing protein [Thiothrix fructosivorans]MBO0614155.1 Hpt domain-containing protein [Thiothrix fructosivorans]QTX12637.1 Hpt domain-containing protein [Thiothrix fructosivorans]